ncbi:MAG: glycerophosphodiester phosphodiesterase [Balneolaceae bacterium]
MMINRYYLLTLVSGFLILIPRLMHSQPLSDKPLPVQLYSDNGDNFVVIAHRGASAYYPENTMSAFKAAYELGAEMIELDITLSKDGEIVVIHDEKLGRTTNRKGRVVDFTLEQLKELDAGSWFDASFTSEKIPTLEEVLIFAKDKIALNIEIKTEAVTKNTFSGIEERSLELVKKYGMEEHVIFSSFDYRAISHLRELDVDIPLALLYDRRQAARKLPSVLLDIFNANAFNCNYRKLSKKWIKDVSAHKIPVFVYTVNKEKDMQKLIESGVSGIFSDKPDVLKMVVDKLWETK